MRCCLRMPWPCVFVVMAQLCSSWEETLVWQTRVVLAQQQSDSQHLPENMHTLILAFPPALTRRAAQNPRTKLTPIAG